MDILLIIPNINAINIGTRGGASKPSSGYTFNFIQKQTNNISYQIKKGKKISNKVHGKFDLFMDKIFLDVLDKNPKRAPKLFYKMLCRLTGDEMALFMSGEVKFLIWIKIIYSLPKKLKTKVGEKKCKWRPPTGMVSS